MNRCPSQNFTALNTSLQYRNSQALAKTTTSSLMRTGSVLNMRPKGRPSEYTEDVGTAICESVAAGDSMREAARKLGLPETTVRQWRNANDSFQAQYARAVIARAEVFFERGNDIAMGIKTGEEAQIARVQLDWLKWSASKLGPKQYGERVEQWISGPDGGPIQASVTVEFVRPSGNGNPGS